MDRKIEKKKGIRPKHAVILLSVGLICFLIYSLVASAGTSVYKIDSDKVTVSEVMQDDFKDYISIIGTVEPNVTIYLDVEEGGKVKEKVIEEGEIVKKGDVIFRLENNDLNLQILNTESNLAYQTNELRNTLINMEQQKISNKQQLLNIDYQIIQLKRTYHQNKVLFDKGFVSKNTYLNAKENYDLACQDRALRYERMVQDSIFRENQKLQMNNSLHKMQRNLEIARQRLEKLNVKAPADGQLGTLNIEIGQSINRGQSVGLLQVLDNFKVVAEVDEHYIDRIKKGLPASFERQEAVFNIITKKIYPEVREGRFKVDLCFNGDQPDKLRTGQTYHIKLELGEPTKAVLISRGGFFQSTGGQWVYMLDESGQKATKRNIRIGRQNPLYYEVLEGLKPGEKIITSSYDLFGDNDVIELK